jgi:carotenoid 1,2-hydratase
MNILSDFSKDTQTNKPIPGSYEWWYFDGISEGGQSFVIIFYEGNPFSKRYIRSLNNKNGQFASQFPAISISVYKNSKPIFYCFEETIPSESSFSPNQPQGNVGDNFFKGTKSGDKLEYEISLNQRLPGGDNISGKLSFQSKPFNHKFKQSGRSAESMNHSWNLVQPKCAIEGELSISGYRSAGIKISGTGYHDHNFGSEPMKDTFDEWYWGRYHFTDSTLIYYIMREKGVWEKKAWLIDDNGAVYPANTIELKETGLSFFGLKTARVIEFKGDGFRAMLQKQAMIDSGPFYQRFSGRLILQKGDQIKHSNGISEYIYPSRIYNKLFWPLVDMRIKYPGNPHWVQKIPLLYRWTW